MYGNPIIKLILSGFIGLVALCLLMGVSLKGLADIGGIASFGGIASMFLALGVIGFFTVLGLKIARFVI